MNADRDLELLNDLSVRISVEVGTARMPIGEILKLGTGSLVRLDRSAAEPVDLLVNGKLLARGEIVALDDSYGLRITELIR